MAQIRGVINQAHRNYELETFKKMYHSTSARSLDLEHNNNNSESDDDNSDFEEEFDNNVNNNTKSWESTLNLWNRMLEAEGEANREAEREDLNLNNYSFDNESATSFLTNCIHPQRDNNAKWELSELFSITLGPPSYISQI
jgi:hypothetical protein